MMPCYACPCCGARVESPGAICRDCYDDQLAGQEALEADRMAWLSRNDYRRDEKWTYLRDEQEAPDAEETAED